MNFLRETALLLRNTVLVTAAVIVGFWAASVFKLPQFLWFFCLLPAGYLYLKLSGTKSPGGWKVLAFFSIHAAAFLIYSALISPHVTGNHHTLGLALTGALTLLIISKLSEWHERQQAKRHALAGRTAPPATDDR